MSDFITIEINKLNEIIEKLEIARDSNTKNTFVNIQINDVLTLLRK